MTELTRSLRKKSTQAGQLLWEQLRDRCFLGLKFKRQKAIGRYVVDFYCAEKDLAVELDGSSHNNKIHYDNKREEILKASRIRTIRFTNDKVLFSMQYVLFTLKSFLTDSPSPITGRRARDEGVDNKRKQHLPDAPESQ